MGMAAGQARLLSITSRMSDNELRAQIINNNKMRLATESSQVSENYVTALNQAQLMFTNYNADNNTTYQQLTFNALNTFNPYNNQYCLTNASGQILLSEADAINYEKSGHDLNAFLAQYGIENTTTYFEGLKAHVTPDGLPTAIGNGDIIMYGGGENKTPDVIINTIKNIYDKDYQQKPDYYYDYLANIELFQDAYADYQLGLHDFIKEKISHVSFNVGGKNLSFDEMRAKISELTFDPAENADKLHITKDNNNKSSSTNTNLDNFIDSATKFLGNDTITKYIDDGAIEDYSTALTNLRNGEKKYNVKITNYDPNDPNKKYNGDYVKFEHDGYTYIFDSNETNIKEYYDAIKGNTNKAATAKNNAAFILKDNIYYGPDGKPLENPDVKIDINKREVTEYFTNQEVKDELLNIIKSMDSNMYYEANYEGIDFSDTTDTNIGELKERLQTTVDTAYKLLNGLGITSPGKPDISGKYDKAGGIENYLNLANEACDFETFYGTFTKTEDTNDNITLSRTNITLDTSNEHNGSSILTTINNILLIENVLNTYGEPKYTYIDKNNPNNNGEAKAQWYINMFDKIEACGYHTLKDGLASSSEWIRFAFESGIVGMEQIDVGNNWNPIIYSNCSDITEKNDEVAVARAEAEYKSAMNKIENKDKRYDLELKNIDTEHNSLQTEYDSIKNAISKNIERTFKIYL